MSILPLLKRVGTTLVADCKASVIGAALVVAVGAIFMGTRLGEGLNQVSFDLLAQTIRGSGTADVIMVEMDEPAYRALDQDYAQLWDRSLHARLLDKLAADGARITILDVFFGDSGTNLPPGPALAEAVRRNQVLAEALQSNQRVVVAAEWSEATHASQVGGSLNLPHKPFTDAVSGRWGIAKVWLDPDGRVRRHFTGTELDPSLSWRAAELLGMPGAANAPDRLEERWIRYYGPTPAFQRISYHQAFEQPAEYFRDKIVVVGGRPRTLLVGQQTDVFPTPPMRWRSGFTPGSEIVATMTLNLVRGEWLRRLPFFVEFGLVIAWGTILGWGLVLLPPARATLVALLAALVAGVFGWFLTIATSGWYAWVIVCVVQTPLALGWSVLRYTRRINEEKQVIEASLAKFQAGDVSFKHGRDATVVVARGTALARADEATIAATVVEPPVSIPNHQLLRLCGEGAYGQVWLARDEIGSFHAVKVVFRRNFKNAVPYETEFRGLKKFTPISRNHAGLVHILHVGRNDEEGYFFYIMEAADPAEGGLVIDPRTYNARNLFSEISRRQRLPLGECLDLGLHLTAALDYLHGKRLVHRDIKPANILYVDGQPKLADIGLVTEATTSLADATYVGTPGYIAPEGPGRPEGDIYALGMVLYEAVTGQGRREFPKTPTDLEREPGVPEFMKIVYQACEHDPLARYQNAAEMHRALLALKQVPELATPE